MVKIADIPFWEELTECGMTLAGGAVVDLIRGQKPKDYDWYGNWKSVYKAQVFLMESCVEATGNHFNPTYDHQAGYQFQLMNIGRAGIEDVVSTFDFNCCRVWIEPWCQRVRDLPSSGSLSDIISGELIVKNKGYNSEKRAKRYIEEKGFTLSKYSQEKLDGPVTQPFSIFMSSGKGGRG